MSGQNHAGRMLFQMLHQIHMQQDARHLDFAAADSGHAPHELPGLCGFVHLVAGKAMCAMLLTFIAFASTVKSSCLQATSWDSALQTAA